MIPVDSFSFLTEIRANPAAFGFTNITTPGVRPVPAVLFGARRALLPAATSGSRRTPTRPSSSPTASTRRPAGQALIAQFVESMIDGPHQYSLLAESLLHTRAGHLRTLNDGLMLARNRPEGERWNVFAAIDHGDFEIDNEPGVQGLKNTANSGSVGVTTNLSEAVTLGIAAGQSKSRNQFTRGTGNYNTDEKILSLFGSVKMGGFYAHRRGVHRRHRRSARSAATSCWGRWCAPPTPRPKDPTPRPRSTRDGISGSGSFTSAPMVGVTAQSVYGEPVRRDRRGLVEPAHRRADAQVRGVELRRARHAATWAKAGRRGCA